MLCEELFVYLGSAREGEESPKAVPRFVGSTEIVTQEASAGAGAPWLEAAAFWERCPWVVCWVFPLTWEFYCAKGSYFSKAHDEMYHLSGKYLNISIMYNVLSDVSCISHVCFGQHFGHLSKQSMKHKRGPHWSSWRYPQDMAEPWGTASWPAPPAGFGSSSPRGLSRGVNVL